MVDILIRLADSSPNESSHELYCRCLDAAEEISRLRVAFRVNILRLAPDYFKQKDIDVEIDRILSGGKRWAE